VLSVHLHRRPRRRAAAQQPPLSSALTGITAAVVGVIANLGLYFALHTLFEDTRQITAGSLDLLVPELGTIQLDAVAITAAAAVMLFRLRWSALRTLAACAFLGLSRPRSRNQPVKRCRTSLAP